MVVSKRNVVNVTPMSNKQLLIQFENDDLRVFDVSPYISGEWFGRLADDNYFSTVHPCGATVEWADGQDIAPHELYENSIPYVPRAC